MSVPWRTVRVFFSSTFRDMHAERDHLIKVTFPALRERLLPHRVELHDIDLRWGITEDEAKNEKVIALCLEQVDECRPFFLAFLGHRYGWVPDRVPDETTQKFPLVSRFPGVSVTELEIRHGAVPDGAGGHTLILLREEDAVASIPTAIRNRDFVETDPRRQQKLEALRQELETGPYQVRAYSAVWDPQRYDRVNRTAGRLEGLGGFGKQVEEWLWEAIRRELHLPETPAGVDPLDAEADLHERFLELWTRIYVGREALYRCLRDFALDNGEIPLLLTGESGSGKSAALAHFVRDFRQQYPDVFVLPHFVGASPRTTSLPGMLRRITDELGRQFNLTLPKAGSPDEILRTFLAALTRVPESARVVLVFDALNQLDADSRADTLVWLPEKLPANVRVLCSAATSTQQAPHVLTAFGEREYVAARLEPLTDAERRDIIRAVPKLVAKSLDDHQIDALLANPATHNPLFLMVALEELRGYGSFEHLNELIGGLPREGDAVTELFTQVFNRLELEFNQPLVDRTLRSLACARRGLSGPELVELTRDLGEQADDLYPLLRQLRPYLQDRDGLLDFYHRSLRRAVELRYLRWDKEEDRHDPWSRWDPERETPAGEPTEPERETRERLIDFFATARLRPRSVAELPWQLAQLRSWQRLFDLLGDLTFFSAAWQADEFEVRTAWSLVKTVGGLEPSAAYEAVLANPADHRSGLWDLALYLQQSGYAAEAGALWSFLTDRCRHARDQSFLAGCLGNQAVILLNTGDLDDALRLFKEQEAICRRLDDLDGLANSLGNQALILRDTGDLDGALRMHQAEEALRRQLNDLAGVARSLGNQALFLRATGELDKAWRLFKEEETLCRQLSDPAGLARSLGNQALFLRAAGHFQEAMRLHKEEESLWRRLNDPAELAGTLNNQALVFQATGDPEGAMRLFKELEQLCRRLNDTPRLATCLGNQGLLLWTAGELDGAMRLLKEQEVLCRSLGDLAGLSRSLGGQALVLEAGGELDEARRRYQEEEALCRRLRDPAGLAICLGNQAILLRKTREPEGALRLYQEQEGLYRRLNDLAGLSECLKNQLLILRDGGDPSGTLRVLREQEKLYRRVNDLAGLRACLRAQATILQDSGDLVGALRLHQESEVIGRQLGMPGEVSTSLTKQAMILKARGNLDGAMRLLKEVEAICRRCDDRTDLYRCLGNQALVLQDAGDLDGAMRLLNEVEAFYRESNDDAGLSATLGNQALILIWRGSFDGAMRLLKEQEAISRRLDDLDGLANSLGNQAAALQSSGDVEGALRLHKEAQDLSRQLNDPAGQAISLANQASLLAFERSRPEEGLPLAEEALRLATQYGLLALARQVEPIVARIRTLVESGTR